MASEIKFGITFFIIIFSLFLQSIKLPFIQENGAIGAGFFPIIFTVLTMILMIIYLGALIMKKEKYVKKENNKNVILTQFYLAIILTLSMVIAIYFGLLAMIGLFLLISFVLIEKLSWKKSIIFSVITTACIFVIFDIWLGLNFPAGIFE